ncbi:unnamed protein product [Caenorhabditis angaria]|uniref:Uncharacterized protein n=1 Tax=Caenorhabditis angaria TaxID=860376 RepID=A0A9P1IQN8_9PELO|nr:unnamed protein product [Caenorhabditis angaria]
MNSNIILPSSQLRFFRNPKIIVKQNIEYLLLKDPKKIQSHKHSFPNFEFQGVQLCCAEYFSSNVNSRQNWLIDCTITVQHNEYKSGQKSNSYVIFSKILKSSHNCSNFDYCI